MNEKEIFDEKQVTKRSSFSCPFCREHGEYDVRWIERRKKKKMRGGGNPEDRARFEKSRDYLIRVDDMLACKNTRCRKRFEIPNSQSVVFI